MEETDFNKINRIHFIGIGGIGLSAIAKLMLVQGKNVSGSDASDSEILEDLRNLGAKIFIGQKAENFTDDVEIVIYTLAIPGENPERAKAEKLKIPMLTYPEALGILFNDKYGIAICGTHGKSTVTSMVSLVLAGAGLDPSVVVGSKVPEFARLDSARQGGNLRIGNSKYFVIEACEYDRAFLEYYPKVIILNNIELDHTDYYKNIEDYRRAFEEFTGHLPKDGVLILNGDGEEMTNFQCQMIKQFQSSNVKIISYGFGENSDVKGYDFKVEDGKTKFKVNFKGKKLGYFILKLPGKFNVYNALAAIALGLRLEIDKNKIKKSLADFGGIWRRFEVKGEYSPAVALKLWRGKGAIVISDYAHHPTAVKATIEAAREFYPGRRIVAVFQPHQHNRTKILYQDFLKSFDSADMVILAEIFGVAGREEKKDQNVSSRGMAEDIKDRMRCHSERSPAGRSEESRGMASVFFNQRDPSTPLRFAQDDKLKFNSIFYASNLAETRKLIDEKIQKNDIVLVMGAGDIYKVADEMVK